MSKRNVILFLVSLFVAFVIGFLLASQRPLLLRNSDTETKTDTLYVRDTITQIKPIVETRTRIEKVAVLVTDTMRVHDTLFVFLDREKIEWQDTLCRVYASGIEARIDSVQHYVTERVVTNTITVTKKTRWGLGVQAGIGAGVQGITPYIGIGVSYNILCW